MRYDADGNLTNDGRFAYYWDAENRLLMLSNIANIPASGQFVVKFSYDYQGRRIQKLVLTNNGSGWVPSYTNKFLYDGWNVIAVLDGGTNLIRSFAWGSDLSGSMQAAGGVGGLISMTVYGGANAGTYFYCYDGNGNVIALVNAASGAIAAQYEYGPFGELLRATGPLAFTNPFRFSTKYQDDETGLLYYGYRFYNPSTAKWPSRDPIGERGGMNLFAFVGNNSINTEDAFGACTIKLVSSGSDSVNRTTRAGFLDRFFVRLVGTLSAWDFGGFANAQAFTSTMPGFPVPTVGFNSETVDFKVIQNPKDPCKLVVTFPKGPTHLSTSGSAQAGALANVRYTDNDTTATIDFQIAAANTDSGSVGLSGGGTTFSTTSGGATIVTGLHTIIYVIKP